MWRVLAIALAVAWSAGAAWSQVQVTVDNNPVAFESQPPVQRAGRAGPLRGVFEQMGASVQYDAPTRTVTAARGATRIEFAGGR